eukprot:Skav228766  [mRNA]  locus=scaffold589:470386:472194:- [translate_table: standard]
MRHGFPRHGIGGGSAANFSLADFRRWCPLGAATLAIVELLSSLLRFFDFFRVGRHQSALMEVQAHLSPASHEFSAALKMLHKPWLLVFLLPATRWPVLDFLAYIERHVLPKSSSPKICMENSSRPTGYEKLIPKIREIAQREAQVRPKVHAFTDSDYEVRGLLQRAISGSSSKQQAFLAEQGEPCRPLLLQQFMVTALVCLESNAEKSIGFADPHLYLGMIEDEMRHFMGQVLWRSFVAMPFGAYPVFGLWLRLRALCTHRLELPLGAALGKLFSNLPGDAPPRLQEWSTWAPAFGTLKVKTLKTTSKTVVIATMCWGQKMAERLRLWLRTARKAQQALGVLVNCLDPMSLASCRAANAHPRLCVDASTWPKSEFSKILMVAMCLRQGFDTLWLDLDTVMLNDPVRRLPEAMDLEMFFSIEADSVNCINTGIFFMRPSPRTQRFLGHWASLFYGWPVASDQEQMYFLLRLLPGLDFDAFADREGLLAGDRARALGPLEVPAWGSLEPRVDFTLPVEVNYGGVQQGQVEEVAVIHLLDSFPEAALINQKYQDLRAAGLDVVNELLKGLFDGSNGTTAMDLLRRNERTWGKVKRDCRSSYNFGR